MSDPAAAWRDLARRGMGEDYATAYDDRFAALAATGTDVHGEAAFVAALLAPGARVLDAGCGTGRVGRRLAELGFDVVGVDADPAMVAVARERSPAIAWHVADLAGPPAGLADSPFDAVVLAGNVVPFLAPGSLPRVAAGLVAMLRPGGLVVCGFGLARATLPAGVPVLPLAGWETAAAGAGLALRQRYGGWSREEFTGDYAVTVHAAPA